MGAIDIQVTVTKILYKDYGDSLIDSFRSFLGQKEVELGDSGRPTGVSRPSLQKETGRGDPRPDVQKRVRFEGLDGESGGARDVRPERHEGGRLLVGPVTPLVPTYDEACRALAQTSPLLAERLTPRGLTSCSLSTSLPPEPTLFVPDMPLVRSLTGRSPPSQQATNFATFSQVVDRSPTTTPLEDFDAFTVTPLDIGPLTMTEIVDQFMEDLLTQEFSPVVLAEDS